MNLENLTHENRQAIFTIADADYSVMALTMFDSVREFYQDSDLFLFIIGTGTIERLDNDVNVIYVGDLLDNLDLSQRLVYYLNVELATSFRPHCFEFLFARKYERTIYLDPDIYVFRRMTEVDDLLNGDVNGIVTPHALKSVSSGNGAVEGDRVFLQCGIFNMGFLALKNTDETIRMLAWWKEKLKWHCIVDLKNGYFVDQKWLEFLPVYFDGFHILKLPTYNLAPWNSEHYKILSDLCGKFFIDDFDHAIAFIHFSGIKRSEHHFANMIDARSFYLDKLEKRKSMKLDFASYEIKFSQSGLHLDKVCAFLYKDYINNTKDTESNPMVDPGFYNFLHGIDDETKFPLYIRKFFEMMPDVFVRYFGAGLIINYENLILLIKDGLPFDGVVNLETVVKLKNENSNGKDEIKKLSLFVQLHRIIFLLRGQLKKTPLFVSLYLKLKRILPRFFYPKIGESNQTRAVMAILLKKVSRPDILK